MKHETHLKHRAYTYPRDVAL